MATLLRIDSSPLDQGNSFSRQLTTKFVEGWVKAYPDGRVISRDLAGTPLPPVTAAWIGAAYTPAVSLTPRQKEVLALSDELIGDLEAADEYVFGVPMYNFS